MTTTQRSALLSPAHGSHTIQHLLAPTGLADKSSIMCVRVCLCVSSEQGSKRSVCQWHREDDKSGWQLLSKALNKDFQKEQPNTEYLTPPPRILCLDQRRKTSPSMSSIFFLPFSKCSGMPKIGNTSQVQLQGNLGAVLFD